MTSGHSLSDLLIIYLYENRYLSLPKLGRFDVSDEIDLSQPETVEFSRIPEGYITFRFNKEEGTDTELIKYITGHTRKMQSLAVADLFTLTDQVRQMLNILQPVSFSGIGTLKKEAKGGISFTPGIYRRDLLGASPKGKAPSPPISEKPVSFSNVEKNRSSRSLGGILIILICLIVAVGLIFFMFSNGDKTQKVTTIALTDSSTADSSLPSDTTDTIIPEKTGFSEEKPVNREGVISYEVVFQRMDSAHAVWRVNQLKEFGHKVIVRTPDSVHYFLSVSVTSMASDTTRIKDSLQVFFGHPTTIRYNTAK